MRALNLPNLLTLVRLLASPQIPIALMSGYNPLWLVWNTDFRIGTFVFAVILALTDLLDGTLAKWLGQETSVGKRLDPIADFIFCCSLFVSVLVIYGTLNTRLYACWLVFACYFMWYAITVTQLRMAGKISSPNMYAKTGMCALMSALIFVIIGTFWWPYFIWHLMAVGAIIVAVLLTSKALDEYKVAKMWQIARPNK